jgi:hypothetical protein
VPGLDAPAGRACTEVPFEAAPLPASNRSQGRRSCVAPGSAAKYVPVAARTAVFAPAALPPQAAESASSETAATWVKRRESVARR